MNPVNLELSDQKVSISQRLLMSWWQLLVLVGLVALVYYSIFRNLIHQWWNDPNFSHWGPLVPSCSCHASPLFCCWRA